MGLVRPPSTLENKENGYPRSFKQFVREHLLQSFLLLDKKYFIRFSFALEIGGDQIPKTQDIRASSFTSFCYGNKIGPKTVETEEKVGKRGFSLYTTFKRHCTNKMRRLAALISQKYLRNLQNPKSLKITEKVSFNIASEASYIYMLVEYAKNGSFWTF